MKTRVYIQNLRCGGCAKSIESALSTIEGLKVIKINTEEDYLEYNQDGDEQQFRVLNKLKEIGYPPADENNNIGLKTKSIISCLKGRLGN